MLKKFFTHALFLGLILISPLMLCACDNDNKSKIETWDGTQIDVSIAENDIITIETAEELAGLAKEVNQGNDFAGKTIKLMCDIDLLEKPWNPIGYGSISDPIDGDIMEVNGKAFKGTFDGQNHTIYNANIIGKFGGQAKGSAGVGFFGLVLGEVKNLKFEDAEVIGNHFVGVVAGCVSGYNDDSIGKITNCYVIDSDVHCTYVDDNESGDKAGVIAGMLCKAELTNCFAIDSEVDADRDAGQLIGCQIYNTGCDTLTGNKVLNVEVEWNKTGEGKKSTSGTNITNGFVGRES